MWRSAFVSRHGQLVVSTVSALVGLAIVAAGAPGSRPVGEPGSTSRVSVTTTGHQANGNSYGRSLSADGRFVVFDSEASNLVHRATGGPSGVFVRDRVAHTTRLISVSTSGVPANDLSFDESISADGRYVAFVSFASNLVAGAKGGLFVRDRVAHTTHLVSVSPDGRPAGGDFRTPSVSAHGRFVAFVSDASNLVGGDTNGAYNVFVRDRARHATRLISVRSGGRPPIADSFEPSISAGGRYVAFISGDSHLVPGDTNSVNDVFIRDRVRHTTRLISVGVRGRPADDGSYGPSMSADGGHVAFVSKASNLVRGDSNGTFDVFVRDRVPQTTRRVSVSMNGHQTSAPPHDMAPSISADGRFVAFASGAPSLVAGDTNHAIDVFVRDTVAHSTRLVSVSLSGTPGNSDSAFPWISANGRSVAFTSDSSDLVPNDANRDDDVFVRDVPSL
jgi:Tol biopolymer transport system component